MNLGDLTEHLAAVTGEASLELPYAGKVYRAPQPGLTRGVRCTQYLAAATREEKLAVLGEDTLPDLTLTRAVVEQMDADDVPITVVTTLAHVALVAWVRGPAVAEDYVRRLSGGASSGEAKSGSRSRKKTGTATASARRIRKPASGRTTGSPPTS